ncbi:hypothetical protein JTE90_020407 [Oedothorax gibbosus]|uniref:Sodium-dependent multivitamin transporter n=1 Tax=Oedothorax gibbosus TaxID=931172 RepID=A0AAV6UGU3_9ARAC|nr:hypothetical protein JTE90_020407 [Oedothorax gibbosus]
MESGKAVLGVVDYVIFGLMLVVSAGIGVYFRFSGGKQRTTEEYLMAGRDMPMLPVTFSLMASFVSAITIIGIPAEMYRFGTNMAYLNFGVVIGVVLTTYLTLPVFFQLQNSSIYEYIDRRFGKYARTLTSIGFVLQAILYMAVVLYAPALALSAVTNLSIRVSVVSIGIACTFYCTLGGMKAVLWTDVLQASLMFIGILAVIIKGLMDLSITQVYRKGYDGGRLLFPSFDYDPTVRYTVWNILIQGIVLSLTGNAGSQIMVQRLLTMKDISRARMAMFLSIPMSCGFHLLACFAGIIIYARYADCDPMSDGSLSSTDQIMPYFMMSSLGDYPGLPGLCICGVFSGSLSTVSSTVNSLTAVTMQDFIRPYLESRGKSLQNMVRGAKVLTLFYGILGIALTFIVALFGNLLQSALIVFGLIGSPILAIFILGMCTTRTNEKGAVIGLLSGIIISSWISFSATSHGPPRELLPISVAGCPSLNSTVNEIMDTPTSLSPYAVTTTAMPMTSMENEDDVFILYRISYMWYSLIGVVSTLVVGYLASIIINILKGKTEDVPLELISPMAMYFWNKEKMASQEKKANKNMSLGLQEVLHSEAPDATNVKKEIKANESKIKETIMETMSNSWIFCF